MRWTWKSTRHRVDTIVGNPIAIVVTTIALLGRGNTLHTTRNRIRHRTAGRLIDDPIAIIIDAVTDLRARTRAVALDLIFIDGRSVGRIAIAVIVPLIAILARVITKPIGRIGQMRIEIRGRMARQPPTISGRIRCGDRSLEVGHARGTRRATTLRHIRRIRRWRAVAIAIMLVAFVDTSVAVIVFVVTDFRFDGAADDVGQRLRELCFIRGK
jgi:hypothetical protein